MECHSQRLRLRKRQDHRFSPGFTVVEAVLVTVILGIAAVVALPMLSSSLEEARLSAAASEVVAALEYAQLSAATSGQRTRVVVSYTLDTIYVRQFKTSADLFNGGDALAAADVEGGTWEYMEYPLRKGGDYVIDLKTQDRCKGVDVYWSDFNILLPVYFDTLGTPSKGGTVTLTLGGRQMVVTLDALTGKVTVTD